MTLSELHAVSPLCDTKDLFLMGGNKIWSFMWCSSTYHRYNLWWCL